MAKQKAEVDKGKLQLAIDKAEENGPLAGRTVLWQAVAPIYNSFGLPVQVTASMVYLRFMEMGLTCKTPLGRKGGTMSEEHKAKLREARKGMTITGRRSRAEKMAELPLASEHFEKLRSITPSTYQGLLKKVEAGSLTAAIKMLCVQCMGFERTHVKDCGGLSCPMYLHRPYQKNTDDDDDDKESDADLPVVPAV